MEVYNCLNNIINKIDSKKIIYGRTLDNALVIIDLYKLKNNKLLEGAKIFKMLFCISDTSPFGSFPMNLDENGYFTLLKDLHINFKEWLLFTIFLEKGYVLGYKDYLLEKKEYNFLETTGNIKKLEIICCKFGGIPSFDSFCENFYKNIEEEDENYTPKTPEEDINNKYQWEKTLVNSSFHDYPNLEQGWSLASTTKVGVEYFHNYYKKWD